MFRTCRSDRRHIDQLPRLNPDYVDRIKPEGHWQPLMREKVRISPHGSITVLPTHALLTSWWSPRSVAFPLNTLSWSCDYISERGRIPRFLQIVSWRQTDRSCWNRSSKTDKSYPEKRMSFRGDPFALPRRRYLWIACFALIGISFVGLLGSTVGTLRPSLNPSERNRESWLASTRPTEPDQLHFQKFVKGAPTNRFRGIRITKNSNALNSSSFCRQFAA